MFLIENNQMFFLFVHNMYNVYILLFLKLYKKGYGHNKIIHII